MPECWLKTNRRALAVAFVFPAVLLLLAVALGLFAMSDGVYQWMVFAAVLLAAVSIVLGIAIIRSMILPRLEYENGFLLAYLRGRHPMRVPIDIVEVFFLGQGPSLVKARDGGAAETSTIVIRLAESGKEWHNREVDASLGEWMDGYIVIRGTWCEPINAELMKRLNSRLVEAHRQHRQAAEKENGKPE